MQMKIQMQQCKRFYRNVQSNWGDQYTAVDILDLQSEPPNKQTVDTSNNVFAF